MTEKGAEFLTDLESAWEEINDVVSKIKASPNPSEGAA